MNIAVVGLGLIGGSICKALKQNTGYRVYGTEAGAADFIIEPEGLGAADLIFVCLYPLETVKFIKQNTGYIKKGCVVTDVCGVKKYVEDELDGFLRQNGCCFVGGHPMAGKESGGFENSAAALLKGASYILTKSPLTDAGAFGTVKSVVESMGCRAVITDSESHDKIIAYTSQLAHVVSSSYVKSPTVEHEKGFTGGSFQDMTRVAALNEKMWADLFLLNKENLTAEIDNLIEELKRYRKAIGGGDKGALIELLKKGSEIKGKH
jgi:prephenate dehydrogenase